MSSTNNRFSVGLSVLNPDGDEINPKTHVPIHFLREHTPKAISRFASPSCPWPWAGDTESDERGKARTPAGSRAPSPTPAGQMHPFTTGNWQEYPGAFFPNWTPYVVERCGMNTMFVAENAPMCRLYPVEVMADAKFCLRDTIEDDADTWSTDQRTNNIEHFLTQPRNKDLRLRCLCVENVSGATLKLLGAYYRIEPFFFSSAINRIASRYHEHLESQHGDHMYITLPFLRATKSIDPLGFDEPSIIPAASAVEGSINVFAPLSLVGSDNTIKHTLQQDMLAVLMIRVPGQETIVTVHPGPVAHSARTLQDRIFMAGKGVYWGNLMQRTSDPIFVLLIVMWSALYAWDEAMETLYTHITYLEARVIKFTLADVELSPQLHAIRAHLLYYDDLLDQFKKSLKFIEEAGAAEAGAAEAGEAGVTAQGLLRKEIKTLLNEVDRLRRHRDMQDSRLNNVMKLVFSILNIKETQASLLHGESMKQITYLTMVYLPASFIASIFGMNVREIAPDTNGTLPHYVAAMVPLTALTVWLAIAVTGRVERPGVSMIWHLLWPVVWVWHQLRSIYEDLRDKYFKERERLRAPGKTLAEVDERLPRPRRSRSGSRSAWEMTVHTIEQVESRHQQQHRQRSREGVRHMRSDTQKRLGALFAGAGGTSQAHLPPSRRDGMESVNGSDAATRATSLM